MYMIAGLCMLKLYQKRHPDINASAYTAYACLAMVIFFFCARSGTNTLAHTPNETTSGWWSTHKTTHAYSQMFVMVCLQVFGKGNTAFWIVFSVIHILATLLLSTQLYYMGRWRLGKVTATKTGVLVVRYKQWFILVHVILVRITFFITRELLVLLFCFQRLILRLMDRR